jgi:hypothetical protein
LNLCPLKRKAGRKRPKKKGLKKKKKNDKEAWIKLFGFCIQALHHFRGNIQTIMGK